MPYFKAFPEPDTSEISGLKIWFRVKPSTKSIVSNVNGKTLESPSCATAVEPRSSTLSPPTDTLQTIGNRARLRPSAAQ